jgi:hypothetical protein
MEYLSKYQYAVPIRSKTAEEMAQKFFIYISMFGPPKEIISDQGREFVNKIMKETDDFIIPIIFFVRKKILTKEFLENNFNR